MELMEEAMVNGSEDDSDARDESDTAEKGITAGENLSRRALKRVERPHAGKNHRGIRERIQPRELFKIMIAGHSDQK